MARLLAAAVCAFAKRFFAALHESRERQAARVIARHRHLSEDAEQFYKREISGKRSGGVVAPSRHKPRPLYIDPMQGTQ